MLVGAFGGLPLIWRTVLEPIVHPDALDHEHTLLDLHVALGD
jgi:hypothetical protein